MAAGRGLTRAADGRLGSYFFGGMTSTPAMGFAVSLIPRAERPQAGILATSTFTDFTF